MHHVLKKYGGVALPFLISALDGSGQLHTPTALPPPPPRGESPRYHLNRRLGGLKIRCGRCGVEKSLSPAINRNPTVQPVARGYTD
jgi:hypothetical protein